MKGKAIKAKIPAPEPGVERSVTARNHRQVPAADVGFAVAHDWSAWHNALRTTSAERAQARTTINIVRHERANVKENFRRIPRTAGRRKHGDLEHPRNLSPAGLPFTDSMVIRSMLMAGANTIELRAAASTWEPTGIPSRHRAAQPALPVMVQLLRRPPASGMITIDGKALRFHPFFTLHFRPYIGTLNARSRAIVRMKC